MRSHCNQLFASRERRARSSVIVRYPACIHRFPPLVSPHLIRLVAGLGALARLLCNRHLPKDPDAVKAVLVPFVRHLPTWLREPMRKLWRVRFRERTGSISGNKPDTVYLTTPATEYASYAQRIAQERAIFSGQTTVHDLPPIFHYWSNKYLLPMEQQFGFSSPEDFFTKYLLEAAQRTRMRRARFISLGAGNSDAEVRIAQNLVRGGLNDFVLECLEINPAMLDRGRALARGAGLERHVVPIAGDFNYWNPEHTYDAILANQSLHHVLRLEALLDAVKGALHRDGLFMVSDMIGRNGHQRWPEALAIVREFWRELPESYRYNLQLQRQENEFLDWDCSTEGFEGIRAQDILPLLIERFGFRLFLAFGNIIDPFIDRSFGHHFDAESAWDREFIDRVHARDEEEIASGRITPTHMMAVMCIGEVSQCLQRGHLSPSYCMR